jgi:ABC-2 type transport system permease protein
MNSIDTLTSLVQRRPATSPRLGVYLREIRAEILRSLRTPAFLVPTLAMPLGFYTLFALVLAPRGSDTGVYILATYGVLAALGPCLFGFGAGIASDRDAGILGLKRISPLPPAAFLIARLASAALFTLVVVLALDALAAGGAGVRLTALSWLALLGVHLLSVLPFCLLGLCIGLRTGASAAMALSNLLFIGLAVLGGLWIPLSMFPQALQQAALVLPTYHMSALALQAVGHGIGGSAWVHGLCAAGYVVLFGGLAWRAWTAHTH